MNKFTDNLYDFVNGCIGFNKNYKIKISGDFNIETNCNGVYRDDLKDYKIIDIEIQYNGIWLIVKLNH